MRNPPRRKRSVPTEFVEVESSAGELLNHHEYMTGYVPSRIRPAKWSMKQVLAELDAMAQDQRWDGNNRVAWEASASNGPDCRPRLGTASRRSTLSGTSTIWSVRR